MKTEELDKIDTIKIEKNEFVNETLIGITKTNWQRNCPQCDDIISYKWKHGYLTGIRENRKCMSCCQKGHVSKSKVITPIDLKRNCPNCNKNISYKSRKKYLQGTKRKSVCKTCSNLLYENPRNTGKKHSYETKLKIKLSKSGKNNHNYGKVTPNYVREKIALSCRINRLNNAKSNFNPTGCKCFDELNKQNGWSLQHALNGGEFKIIGYSLDAYDKNQNIVVEYDEMRHYKITGELRDSDIIRMNRIHSHLNCKFYRYNESKNLLYEVQF